MNGNPTMLLAVVIFLDCIVQVQGTNSKITACRRVDGWRYLAPNKMYYRLYDIDSVSQENGADICQQMGGALVTIPDLNTNNHLEGINSGHMSWIGLFRNQNNRWIWADGRTMEDTKFNYLAKQQSTSSKGCVVLGGIGTKGRWTKTDCDEKHSSLCQSSVPCPAKPAVRVSGGKIVENNATVQVTKPVNVTCLAQGFDNDLVEALLTCAWESSPVGRGVIKATANLFVDRHTHGKECTCSLKHEDKTVEKSTFTIDFQSPPILLSDDRTDNSQQTDDGSRIFHLNETEDLSIYLVMFLNPRELKRQSLVQNGIDVEDFKITVHDADTPNQYEVIFVMSFVTFWYNGSYVLTLGNGVGKPFVYPFELNITKAKIAEDEDERSWLATVFVFSIPLILCAVLCVALVVRRKERKKRYNANAHTSQPPIRSYATVNDDDKEQPDNADSSDNSQNGQGSGPPRSVQSSQS